MSSSSIFDTDQKRSKVNILDHKEKIIYCGNCGEKNHIYKDCPHPILSLGILLYKYFSDTNKIKFLLVRRKDSIGYVEFIRGKYVTNDIEYIEKLFFQMSKDEIIRIKNNNFEYLWENLWMYNKFKTKKKFYQNDIIIAKKKFNSIDEGYYVNDKLINLNYFIDKVVDPWNETEWGIPKGRRNIKETNHQAAIREFIEETGLTNEQFKIIPNIEPFSEEYLGSDNILYKHIYYLAISLGDINFYLDDNSKYQITEISKIGLFDRNQCLSIIRDYYIEKKKIISNAEEFIINHKLYNINNFF